MKDLVLLGGALCLLAVVTLGCNTLFTTTYHVQISTFPPVAADVYIDDELKGRTDENGEATVSSGKKSIFEGTVLSLRKDGMKGTYVMQFREDGAAVSHVVLVGRSTVGVDRHYSVTFSFENLPPPPYAIAYVRLEGVSTAMVNFVRGLDLSDVEAAAARLQPGTRVSVVFAAEPVGRVTDFHYVLAEG